MRASTLPCFEKWEEERAEKHLLHCGSIATVFLFLFFVFYRIKNVVSGRYNCKWLSEVPFLFMEVASDSFPLRACAP